MDKRVNNIIQNIDLKYIYTLKNFGTCSMLENFIRAEKKQHCHIPESENFDIFGFVLLDSTGRPFYSTPVRDFNPEFIYNDALTIKEKLDTATDLKFYAKSNDSIYCLYAGRIYRDINSLQDSMIRTHNGYIVFAGLINSKYVNYLSKTIYLNAKVISGTYQNTDKYSQTTIRLNDIYGEELGMMVFSADDNETGIYNTIIIWMLIFLAGTAILFGLIKRFLRKTVTEPVNSMVKFMEKEISVKEEIPQAPVKEFDAIFNVLVSYREQSKKLADKNAELSLLEDDIRRNNETLLERNERVTNQNIELKQLKDVLTESNRKLKIAGDELYRKERYLQTVINSQGEGMIITDREGVINFINPAATLIFESTREAMLNTVIYEYAGKAQQSFLKEQIKNRSLGLRNTYDLTVDLPSGRKYLRITASPNYDENNLFLGSIVIIGDITTEHNYRLEIEEKNSKLTDFFTALKQNSTAILIADIDATITFLNPAFEKMFGTEYEQLVGKSINNYLPYWVSDIAEGNYMDQIIQGKTWSRDISFNLPDGKHMVHASFSPVKTDDDEIISYMAIFDDITHQRELENQLAKTSELYSSIVKNSLDIIWIFNIPQRRLTYVSPAVTKLRGYTPQEAMNLSTEEVFPPEVLNKITRLINDKERSLQLTKDGKIEDEMRFECTQCCKDGTKLDVEIVMTPLKYDLNDQERLPIEILGISRSIKERKKMENLLRESEKKYKLIAENTGDSIWKVDVKNLNFTYVSSSILRNTGYTPEELEGKNIGTIIGEQEYLKMKIMGEKLLEENKIKQGFKILKRFKITDKKGEQKYIEMLATVINDGKNAELLGVSRDITETVSAEKKLAETNTMLKAVLDNIPSGLYLKDADLRFVMVNKWFAWTLGIDAEEFIGKTVEEMNINNSLLNFFKNDAAVLNTAKPFLYRERKYKVNDDYEMWLQFSQLPYYEEGALSPSGVLSLFTDITERKKFEAALTEKSMRFENTINNLTDIYIRINFNGVILETGPSFCDLSGVDNLSMVTGHRLDEFITANDLFSALSRKENIRSSSFTMKNRKGKLLHCEINLSVFYDSNGNPAGYEGIAHNITDRVRYEQQLATLTESLKNSLEETRIQKNSIESINRGLTESINYAKRIQNSMFADLNDNLLKFLPDNFLINNPCEIVGGDFFFVRQTTKGFVFAVADCTGHGIPGAFMSVLSIGLLNEIINDQDQNDKFSPSGVLETLRERIISGVSKSLILRDGLDICLCYNNIVDNQLIYSGANIPLYLVRDGVLTVYKAVNCPIGLHPVALPFQNTIIDSKKGDMLYLATDGFQDQFGTNENRKFSRKEFIESLSNIYDIDCKNQKIKLLDILQKWKGSRKQTDDITVLGIRI